MPIQQLRPRVDLNRVRDALGGPDAVPADLSARLEALAGEVVGASTSRGCLALVAISEKSEDRVVTEGDLALSGLGVAGLLRQCERLAAFAVSLGPGPEALMRRCNDEGRLVDLTLLDAIASEAVEDLAEQGQSFVEQLVAAERCATTRRCSPGYCDWRLEDQAVIDRLVELGRAGIELTETFVMLPEKSISAIVGIGPRGSLGSALAEQPACARCPKKPECPQPQTRTN